MTEHNADPERGLWHELQRTRDDVAALRVQVQASEVDRAKLTSQADRVAEDVDRLEQSLANEVARLEAEIAKRVTIDRYTVVERLALGLAGLILAAVVMAWIASHPGVTVIPHP